jgi:hypothetical protein
MAGWGQTVISDYSLTFLQGDIGEVVKDGFKLIHDDNDIKE